MIRVQKRDGSLENLDVDKFNKVISWACEDLVGVSASEVALKTNVQFFDKIKTTDLMEISIKSAADLISEDTPNYQFVGGRLINYHLRKEVYGQYNPLPLYDIVSKNVWIGLYDPEILNWYTQEDFNQLDNIIDHDRDMDYVYAGMEQWRGKYLVQDRTTNKYCETPQVAYILIAATLFRNYKNRMKWIKDFYDAISKGYISLATPITAGVRTNKKQFSSCVLIDIDDSLDSIIASNGAIVKYVSQRAGIGVNMRIRGFGSKVGDGLTKHTGVTPYIKHIQSAIGSCSQGGVRNGAGNLNYVFWHKEVRDMLVLKNNKGIEATRARGLDYTVQLNKVMYERLLSGGNISLFSPNEVPGLYEAYFRDVDKFRELYEAAEKNPNIDKDVVPAIELFSSLIQERKDTGRIYIMNIDNVNQQSPYIDDTIYMTNLCTEILQPTTPLQSLDDINGRIALCTLMAINWGIISRPEEFEKYCKLAIYALNSILEYQDYPINAARESTLDYKSLGLGITNYAYWLAKNGLTYHNTTPEGLALIDQWVEAHAFFATKASVEYAEEFGPCRKWENTKYSLGNVPMDYRKLAVDEIIPHNPKQDWESLRKKMIVTGIANTPILAVMPCETSSQCVGSGTTNGIEPIRALVTYKKSKEGVLPQVAPGIQRYKNKYDMGWDQPSPEGYLKQCAIIQKYFDNGMSVNQTYNPINYEKNEVPMSVMVNDIINHYRWGGKTLYYLNTQDSAGEEVVDLESVAIDEEDDSCESCKL